MRPALRRVALFALIVGVGACEENRATTFSPVGPLGFNFGMQASPNGLPSGNLNINNGVSIVTLTLSGLRALQGGYVYEVWGYNQTAAGADQWTPLPGALTENRLVAVCPSGITCPSADTTRDATDHPLYTAVGTVIAAAGGPGIATYVGSDSTREPVSSITWTLSTANGSPLNPASSYHAIVISIEASTTATTPSDVRFLYRRIQPFGSTGNLAMQFGRFGGFDGVNAISSPRDYAFSATGSGAATVRGTEIVANFVGLARPPLGFYYRAVLQDSVGGEVLVDTLRSAYSAQAALNRVNLVDADFNTGLPTVSAAEIKTASVRNCIAGSTELGCPNTLGIDATKKFGPISSLLLVLEPKVASANLLPGLLVGHGVVQFGAIPDPAKK